MVVSRRKQSVCGAKSPLFWFLAVAALTLLAAGSSSTIGSIVRAIEIASDNDNGNDSLNDIRQLRRTPREDTNDNDAERDQGRRYDHGDTSEGDMDSRIVGGPPASTPTTSTRVIGGQEVEPIGRYPYMVELLDEFGSYISGATLVAPDIVLTAGHSTVINIASVAIGRYDLSDPSEDYEEILVTEVILSPNFRPRVFNHDAALLKLARPVNNPIYKPVTLNGDAAVPPDDSTLTVIGWGVDESGGLSDILKETNVTAMTTAECEATSYVDEDITNAMLCATGNGVTDACDGDSGGPLIVKGGKNNDASDDIQVGIVSFGRGCANVNFPGVYTRISYILPWIQTEICRLSPQYCASVVPACVDAEQFTSNGGAPQNCDWVGRRFFTRCPMYGREHCPVTCNFCATRIDLPQGQQQQLDLIISSASSNTRLP
jgi:hypothetical protein